MQEGLQKIADLQHLTDIEWHLIGPLQSNKCKPVAEHFDWVQSVDRLKIAKRLSDNRPDALAPLNVCIQVNISHETSKSGISIQEAEDLAHSIVKLPRLHLRGLMAIPSRTENTEQLRTEFQQLQRCFTKLQHSYDTVDTLSMGMSGDAQLAIECGSTMVRIGTAIFGARKSKIPGRKQFRPSMRRIKRSVALQQSKIAFIGAGNMSRAIISGLIANGYPAKNIITSNPSLPKLDALSADFGIQTTQSNAEATDYADIVFLSVKPQLMAQMCEHTSPGYKFTK